MTVGVKNLRFILLLAACILFQAASGYSSGDLLEQSKRVVQTQSQESSEWISEKTGQYLPLDLTFTDERGKTITLASIVDRPTILLPIYFYCPNICSKNLANLAVALGNLSHEPEAEFRVIALSFNDAESSDEDRKSVV